DGTYRLAQVPTGTRILIAQRIGYAPERRTVTVGTSELRVDFSLNVVATSLDALVVTATGTQRRIELGNAIASVDVRERASSAAITSMGDLLKAQATGV